MDRFVSGNLAIHLGSVASRYRSAWVRPQHPWPAGALPGWKKCFWFASAPESSVDRSLADQKISRVEAVLFLVKEPLSSRKLSQYANLADGTEARTLVRQLNEKLDRSGRAFRVEEVAGGFQLVTRSKFAPWLRRLNHIPRNQRLSAPAMETLALVAYQQPVMRVGIEAIRGVSCGEILAYLLQQDLIRVAGRSSELGRPYLYRTTKRFLRVFGLKSLDELPYAELFRQPVAATESATEEDSVQSSSAIATSFKVEEDSDVTVFLEPDVQSRDIYPVGPTKQVAAERFVHEKQDQQDEYGETAFEQDEGGEEEEEEEEEFDDEEFEEEEEEEEEEEFDDEDLDEDEIEEDYDEEFDDEYEDDEDFEDEEEWEEVEDDEEEWEEEEEEEEDDWEEEEEEEEEDWEE